MKAASNWMLAANATRSLAARLAWQRTKRSNVLELHCHSYIYTCKFVDVQHLFMLHLATKMNMYTLPIMLNAPAKWHKDSVLQRFSICFWKCSDLLGKRQLELRCRAKNTKFIVSHPSLRSQKIFHVTHSGRGVHVHLCCFPRFFGRIRKAQKLPSFLFVSTDTCCPQLMCQPFRFVFATTFAPILSMIPFHIKMSTHSLLCWRATERCSRIWFFVAGQRLWQHGRWCQWQLWNLWLLEQRWWVRKHHVSAFRFHQPGDIVVDRHFAWIWIRSPDKAKGLGSYHTSNYSLHEDMLLHDY